MRIFGAAGDYVQHGQVDSFEASLHGTKDMNSKEEVDRVDELMKKQFSEADLRLLQSLEYKTKFAVKQLARLTAQRAGLDDFMMNIALTESLRLNDVMKKHAGDPSGIEFKQKSRDVWAVAAGVGRPGRGSSSPGQAQRCPAASRDRGRAAAHLRQAPAARRA